MTNDPIIEQTKTWINKVVIGCNFCPFADRVMKKKQVHYSVENSEDMTTCLNSLLQEFIRLDEDATIETSFLIFPDSFKSFDIYLDLVEKGERLLKQKGYTGVYQLASFHPLYQFDGTQANDAANYTNRSPYPMLHVLREKSIEKVLQRYKNPEEIPERNINFCRNNGTAFMKKLGGF